MRELFERNIGSRLVSTLAFNFMPSFESCLDQFAELLLSRVTGYDIKLQVSDRKEDGEKPKVMVKIRESERELPILAYVSEQGLRIGCERLPYDTWRRIAIPFMACANESFIAGQKARLQHLDLQFMLVLSRDTQDHYALLRDHLLKPESIVGRLAADRVYDMMVEAIVEFPRGCRTRIRTTSSQKERSLTQRLSGQKVDPSDDLIFDMGCAKWQFTTDELKRETMVDEFFTMAERCFAEVLKGQDIGGPI